MKYLLILFLFFTSSYANIELSTTDSNATQIELTKSIKKYFKTNQKIGINVRKRPLRAYYAKEQYQLIWFKNNLLSPIAQDLLEVAQSDKIIANDIKTSFNIEVIEDLLFEHKSRELTAKETLQLDLLLTNLYDKYMNCVSKGSIDWSAFKKKLAKLMEKRDIMANWEKYSAKVNKPKLLQETLISQDFNHSMQKTDHSYPNSDKLYDRLSYYENILNDGGYVKVPTVTKSLKEGMSSSVVPLLRERLIQSNDFTLQSDTIETAGAPESDIQAPLAPNMEDAYPQENSANIYNKELVIAVKSFQKSHGLAVDGVCGPDTIRHLNISVDSQIHQIKVNLERMRWMPRELGKDYLIVNIPDYNLRYFKDKKEMLKLSVVVGTKKHPTPIFSHQLSTVVLNPYWRVPKRIVQREIIPKLVKNPSYLRNKDMNIHESWDTKSEIYEPTDINWTQFAQTDLQKKEKFYPDVPYRFIQTPGKKNPLGKMKFMFYNKYLVYLHDTSAKYIFNRRQRAYSHGCIRVHNPYKLLKTIASEDKKLDYTEAKEILEDVEQTEISLNKKIPIHIVYLTAWIDDNDEMQFRDDVYGYDKMQEKILYHN